MTKIILLDIDGVLVQAAGYRAALRATLNYFIGSQFEVDEELLTGLEKRGISSEWDMNPLVIASYWTDILARQPMQNLPDDVSAAARKIRDQLKVDLPTQLSIPEFELVNGQYPADAALRAGHFASIPLDLRTNLLNGTRSIQASHTMQIFQHYTLGSTHFEQTYRLAPQFETESFLLTHDRSNINERVRSRLVQPDHHLAAFTARPSAPPREVGEAITGYAPEAELALELVDLADIPLIAFGKLEYLASQHQLDPATLMKPSAFQALAATLAACTGEEWSSLQAANAWREGNSLDGRFNQLPKKFKLIVVEDTMGGIHSVRAAGELLQKAGFDVQVHPIGLTSGSGAKAAAFQQAGVQYFESWDSLVDGIDL